MSEIEIHLKLENKDIPEKNMWWEIAANIGIENVLILSQLCPGEKLYIRNPLIFGISAKKYPKNSPKSLPSFGPKKPH